MSRTFEIGPGLACDLDLLIPSRMLVQASSGQGKTRTIRRILEQTHGQVQHLVIDPEGEYHTLREKFDYVLAAPKGGDVVASPRYAKLLAEELLRLNVSAILDIYELNPDDRRLFVKNFVMALVESPRELWHPALVVIDEIHNYCPERGDATSTSAIEALSTRGRKRGFCLIAATQRLAKFKKDAAAELGNKLVGGTNLDIDVQRAAEELGIAKQSYPIIRNLKPGQFYATGRAFKLLDDLTYQLVAVGPVTTTHPEPGQASPPAPPPTAKVRAALEKLSSLPAEAEAREKSMADLQKENHLYKLRVKQLETAPQIGHTIERVEVPVLLEHERNVLAEAMVDLDTVARGISALDRWVDAWHGMEKRLDALLACKVGAVGTTKPPAPLSPAGSRAVKGATTVAPSGTPPMPHVRPAASSDALPATLQRIVNVANELERRGIDVDTISIARWLGLHPNGGTYRGQLRTLIEGGYLNDDLTCGECTANGTYSRGVDGIPTKKDQQRAILEVLDSEGARRGGRVTLEDLAAALHVHPNGGTFRGNVRWLVQMGVVRQTGGGYALTAGAQQ